jgi:hypothetical protein
MGKTEDTNFDDPVKFIYQIIESRILGTGVQLNSEQKKSFITYRKIPIWGIKKALITFIKKMYDDVLSNLNLKEFEFSSSFVESNLISLTTTYNIKLKEKLHYIKEPAENWNAMDSLMKSGMLINAFIDTFDESCEYYIEHSNVALQNAVEEEDYKTLRNILQRLNKTIDTSLPVNINYKLEDFGFIFRARIYVSYISKFYNNGYSNVVKRLDEQLRHLFNEYFLGSESKNIDSMNKRYTGNSSKQGYKDIPSKNLLKNVDKIIGDVNLIGQIKEGLNSGDKKHILSAIDSIVSNHLTELKDDLELFFNHSDQEIMNQAFEAYMKITNQN